MVEDFESELRQTFLGEATQLLDDAEHCFLELEENPGSSELIDRIFRLAHNLKGSANAVGFSDLGALTHKMESLLLKVKSGDIVASSPVVNLLLRCNDAIIEIVATYKQDETAKIDVRELAQDLEDAIAGRLVSEARPSESVPAADDPGFQDSVAEEIPGFHVFSEEEPAAPVQVAAPKLQVAKAPPAQDEVIRVSLQRIDKLINFIGELVVLQSVLREQSQNSESNLLRKTVHQLDKVTKEVQDLSMGLRMVPLKQTFQKMQRIVRDTAAALGKKVHLELEGEETEIDKAILESLGDPLVHLIRNAVDHGIEDHEGRSKASKADHGTIRLRAFHQSGRLVIEVIDDGKGLDPAFLIKKATSKGLIKADAKISDRDALQLIFHSGFSTRDAVSDVSGRGVGMDVVKTNIESIKGEVMLDSVVGQGTRISIVLPLTLAIIDAMLIASGDNRFLVPVSHIQESTAPVAADIHTISGVGEVYSLRGQQLPVYRLSHMIGEKRGPKDAPERIALIIRNGDAPYAVLVDDIIAQHQIVTKQLGLEHAHLKGFSGTAIMGDGKALLILEINELVASRSSKSKASPKGRSAA